MKSRKPSKLGSRATKTSTSAFPETAPWGNEIAHGFRSITVQLPSHLYGKLSFVAGTTYGYSMSRIVREALEDKLNLMSLK